MDSGISDEIVLQRANERDALLVTSDKDFGELVFRMQHSHAGVILLRLAGLSPDKKSDVVASAVRNHGNVMHKSFTVISSGMTRIRSARRAQGNERSVVSFQQRMSQQLLHALQPRNGPGEPQ